MNPYDIDVAFSFLQQDEPLAVSIASEIEPRYSCFIFSEKQTELAGTDGEKTLNNIFGEKARTVVVLYRKDWGNTPWTRIEGTAIRNRAYKAGYDFTLFVNLDNTSSLPEYVPKNRIWYDFERYGLSGLIPIIERNIQALFGTVKEDTVETRARKASRDVLFSQNRERYLRSTEVFRDSLNEFNNIFHLAEENITAINKCNSILGLSIKKLSDYVFAIKGESYDIVYEYGRIYNAIPYQTQISVCLYKAVIIDFVSRRKYEKKHEEIYGFDVNSSMQKVWVDIKTKKGYHSEYFFEHTFKCYLDTLAKNQS
jgi:hypothetical protein